MTTASRHPTSRALKGKVGTKDIFLAIFNTVYISNKLTPPFQHLLSTSRGQFFLLYCVPMKNFPHFVVIHTVKALGIVNKAEADAFLELSCFFDDPTNVGKLISGSSASSKTSLNIWNFTVHVLLKPGLEDSNCSIILL